MSFPFSKDLINAQYVLKSLKVETENILNHIKAIEEQAKDSKNISDFMSLKALENSISQIKIGLSDTELMITFSKFIELLEAENVKLQMSLQRQTEENNWLRDELTKYQQIVEKNQTEVVLLKDKLSSLEFQKEIKTITDEINAIPIDNGFSNFAKNKPFFIRDSPSIMSSRNQNGPVNSSMAQSICSFSSRYQGTSSNAYKSQEQSPHDGNSNQLSPSTNSMLGSISSNASAMVPNKFKKLQSLINQYSSEGKYDIAASLCLQTIKEIENSSDSPASDAVQSDVAALLNILAIVYKDQSKYEEAANVLKKVLAIREKTLDPFHPMVAASLNNLSILYAKAGRFQDAEPLCLRALSIREQILGIHHIDVAKQLNNLALLYQGQNKQEEIENCFQRSLEIFKLSDISPTSNQVLRAKSSLASAKLKLNKLEEAERLIKEILTPSTDSNTTPLWKMVEIQAMKEAPYPMPITFNQWVEMNKLDLNTIRMATKNLMIVYQKKGQFKESSLLSEWLRPSLTAHSADPNQYPSILYDRNKEAGMVKKTSLLLDDQKRGQLFPSENLSQAYKNNLIN